jgi:hypothetical protein
MVLYISGCEVIVGNFDVICYGKQVVNFEIISFIILYFVHCKLVGKGAHLELVVMQNELIYFVKKIKWFLSKKLNG